ncbi:MAG: hypothetical protein IJS71_00895 [Clostridia bacterium]|nr:hypothetical protein [Clostridia bacterium]MBR0286216.1 hypothetical protein [Bacteroidales bacterium]
MFGRKKDNLEKYYNKKSQLNSRLQKDVIRNGTAYLSCKVGGLDDILSKFSTKGLEALDGEFKDELLSFADCIPQEYPLVLEILGPKFTEDEKEMIREAVVSDADYLLGKTEADNRHHRKVFWWMVAGTVGSGVLLGVIKHFVDEVPLEFFYVLFWLFADALVRYLFVEHGDYKNDKIRAGRIASMKVEFVEGK